LARGDKKRKAKAGEGQDVFEKEGKKNWNQLALLTRKRGKRYEGEAGTQW